MSRAAMARGHVLSFELSQQIVLEECHVCGVIYGMPAEYRERRLADKRSFYCPNGHSAVYIGKPLRDQLEDAKRALDRAKDSEAAAWGRADQYYAEKRAAEKEAARIKRRLSCGVCPCCKRSFQNLARHMQNKHPELGKESGV